MQKNKLSLIITILTLVGCSKQELISPIDAKSKKIETSDSSILQKTNASRVFVWIGSGPGTFEPWCIKGNGNCLPDVVVTGIAKAYEGLVNAVENDTQMAFFIMNKYSDVYGVEETPHIQDALEKGHLKVKITKFATTEFNLIIKPQHENLDSTELANKVVLAIPIVK